ncbi:RNA-binding domain-containing protein [Gyrodon lividus]|nr:RNA-binding domain-containing protein [Gyrodon lividus]
MSADTLGKRKYMDEDTHRNTGHGSTLFVSNLPYDATSTDLQTTFSDIAPVRSAFVVLEHGTGTSKGVGYVSFSIREDAQMAFDTITADGITINGRKLRVQWADIKPKSNGKDRPEADVVKSERNKRVIESSSGNNVNDPLAIRTIILSGLPSTVDQKTLWKKLRKLEGAEKVDWPAKTSGGEDPSTANVLFTTSSLAQEAVSKLHAHVFKGSLLSVTLKKRLDNLYKAPAKTSEATSAALPSRASRLIVRNLPFDITEQDLRAIFLPYGPIYSIHIPLANVDVTKADADANTQSSSPKTTRSKGFAFVWMLSKKDAEMALKKCNGMKVTAGMANDIVSDKQKRKKQRREEKKLSQTINAEDGEEGEAVELPEQSGSGSRERVIAVDWALSKEKWEEEKVKLGEAGEDPEADVEMNEPEGSVNRGEGSTDSEDEQLGLRADGSGDEDEDSEDDDEEGEAVPYKRDSDDESPKKAQLPHTDTGTTLFIRNIPFTATEDELRTLFRAFGPLRYARIAVDPETERSRGTGFACFWNKEDADKVIEQSEMLRLETTGNQPQPTKNPFVLPSILTPDPSASAAKNLVLDGRTLDVVRAVTRDQATKLKEEGERSREKADKRNLYLLREGVIFPNTPASQTIPLVELEKRTNSFNARRTMLRTNPSLYVSKTRLSIRQVPLFVTERVLKRLAIHSVREFNAEVKKGLRAGLSPEELTDPAKAEDHDAKTDIKEEDDGKRKKPKTKPERLTSVKQAKIIRQADRVDPVTGKGRSRGYGFVEMHTHADALRVLRWANNNPDMGTLLDKWWKEELADLLKKEKANGSPDEARIKRIKDEMETSSKPPKGALIVEFSIENVQVVQRRAAQQEKVVKSHSNRNKLVQGSTEEPPSKKRRLSSAKLAAAKQESLKPGKLIGSVIGRKRRARKGGKSAG